MQKTLLIVFAVLLVLSLLKFLIFGYIFKVFKPQEMSPEEKEKFDREMDGEDDDDFEDLT